jgi:hypothetical protein
MADSKKKQGQQEKEGQQGNIRPDRGQRGQGMEDHRQDQAGEQEKPDQKQKNKDFEQHQEGPREQSNKNDSQ